MWTDSWQQAKQTKQQSDMPIAGLIDGIVDSQRISADGSFISASTVLHCSGWVGDKQQQQQKKKKKKKEEE